MPFRVNPQRRRSPIPPLTILRGLGYPPHMASFDLLRTQVTLVGLGWMSGGLTCLILFADDVVRRAPGDSLKRRWQALRRVWIRRSDVRIGPLARKGSLRS